MGTTDLLDGTGPPTPAVTVRKPLQSPSNRRATARERLRHTVELVESDTGVARSTRSGKLRRDRGHIRQTAANVPGPGNGPRSDRAARPPVDRGARPDPRRERASRPARPSRARLPDAAPRAPGVAGRDR